MTLEEKARLIIRDIRSETGNNPVNIFRHIAKNDYINIHDPEPCAVCGEFAEQSHR